MPLTALTRPPRANILGVGVHALNMRRAVELVHRSVSTGMKGYICVTGVHGVMEARRSAEFRSILDRAFLVTPDGMPTVWVGKLQKHSQMGRVFGPELMFNVCRASVLERHSHFFYGGKPGVANELQANFERWLPGLRILGTYSPPFRALNREEKIHLKESLAVLKPDIIWVGLSTPKQERFMADMIDELDCKLMIGVGAAFDMHTGRLSDAPGWMKRSGLQWMHRLYQEPRRLWKRYLLNNSAFLWHLSLQACKMRRYDLTSA